MPEVWRHVLKHPAQQNPSWRYHRQPLLGKTRANGGWKMPQPRFCIFPDKRRA
jgi:hypothetical protein